jgi:hypothetical protein
VPAHARQGRGGLWQLALQRLWRGHGAGERRRPAQHRYGRNAAEEPAAKQTLASFNSEGKTIEWRLSRGAGGALKPFAAIMRWNTTVSADSGEPVRGEVLVVTRLAPGAVCHIGYVDARANSDANLLARRIADEHAAGFHCGSDKPVILGLTGPGFSGPYGN